MIIVEMYDVSSPLSEYAAIWYSLCNFTQETPIVCSCPGSYFFNSLGSKASGKWDCEAEIEIIRV